jgi:hypothetical protein
MLLGIGLVYVSGISLEFLWLLVTFAIKAVA